MVVGVERDERCAFYIGRKLNCLIHTNPLVPTGVENQGRDVEFGQAVNHLAKLYPNNRFTGFDESTSDIRQAKRMASEMGLTNVDFFAVDVAALDSKVVFDLILPSTRYITGSYQRKCARIDTCAEKTAVCR